MQQKCSKTAEAMPLAELAFRVLILPPISRGAHFVGPNCGPEQHACRLVELWRVADDDQVPLAQAFRLLDVSAVAGAILRGMAELEREDDPRYWTFPTLEELLPELRELAWRCMVAGNLLVEGIKGIRGKRHRGVLPAELPRLTPDWELSRLVQGGRDEFIEVHVQRVPAEPPVKRAWREKPSSKALKDAAELVAQGYPHGARPSLDEFWRALGKLIPGVTRADATAALNAYAPRLKGRRGYRSTKSPT